MTVKHTLVSLDMRVFALCSLMEHHRAGVGAYRQICPGSQNGKFDKAVKSRRNTREKAGF